MRDVGIMWVKIGVFPPPPSIFRFLIYVTINHRWSTYNINISKNSSNKGSLLTEFLSIVFQKYHICMSEHKNIIW